MLRKKRLAKVLSYIQDFTRFHASQRVGWNGLTRVEPEESVAGQVPGALPPIRHRTELGVAMGGEYLLNLNFWGALEF